MNKWIKLSLDHNFIVYCGKVFIYRCFTTNTVSIGLLELNNRIRYHSQQSHSFPCIGFPPPFANCELWHSVHQQSTQKTLQHKKVVEAVYRLVWRIR